MKSKYLLLLIACFAAPHINSKIMKVSWTIEKHHDYNFLYTSSDNENKREYIGLIENGMLSVRSFFNSSHNHQFDIYVHPSRHSLDSSWQVDWNMPNFKSECWMVASGVANKLDMLSPRLWDKEACEHTYSNTIKTQQLIAHELVHVYHGQLNTSHDFSNIEGIDWFVEGLAVYASGQCDSSKVLEIKKAISENKIPSGLDNFWTGKLKYGLSGSVVMYIDKKYGRATLLKLLPYNKKTDLLLTLKTTESELLVEWKKYLSKL